MPANVGTAGDVVWRGGTANSELVSIPGRTICGFYIPSGFAGTTLKVKVANKPTFSPVPLYDSAGNEASYTVAAGRYVKVDPADFAGIEHFQLVSSATEAANTIVGVASREIA